MTPASNPEPKWEEVGPFANSLHDHASNLEDASSIEDVEEVVVECQETLNKITIWTNANREALDNVVTNAIDKLATNNEVLQRSSSEHNQGSTHVQERTRKTPSSSSS